MLLILTSKEDLTADFLIVDLVRRKLPYFRLNVEDLVPGEFLFEADNSAVLRKIVLGNKELDLSLVTAVWYRRAIHPIPPAYLSQSEKAFIAGEFRHLVMGLVLNPEILWVNPIDKVSVAENKLLQLRVARKIGFRIPKTLISSDVMKLRDFAAANAAGTICKPIFHGLFFDGVDRYSIYTRRVTPESFQSEEADIGPVLLQEEIPRKCDVRVTYIGRECFVAEVHGAPGIVDWRDPDLAVRFLPSSIGPDLDAMCRAMLDELGLIYGAFDFIETKDGELVFLEVNPTGEWAWLEDKVGFPMRNAFSELFFGAQK